jgi:hypothetical protein
MTAAHYRINLPPAPYQPPEDPPQAKAGREKKNAGKEKPGT